MTRLAPLSTLLRQAALGLGTLAALLAPVASAQATSNPGTANPGTDVQKVLRAAQEAGPATLTQTEDGPEIEGDLGLLDKLLYQITFAGCDPTGRFCTHMMLQSGWTGLTLEDALTWNYEKPSGRAYMNGDLLVVDQWVSLEGDLAERYLANVIFHWRDVLYDAVYIFYQRGK